MPQLLIHDLYKTTRHLMRQYNERFLTVGITAQQFFILYELPGKTKKAFELAKACGLDRATVTSLLNQLEKKRLIKRTIDKTDRRSVIVDLTPSGRQLANRLAFLAKEFNEVLGSRLGKRYVPQFMKYLKSLES